MFDENLVDDTSGKLSPNKLTVDNLTIDWLRSRLTELESNLKTTQQNRQSPQFPQENNSENSRYKFCAIILFDSFYQIAYSV